MSIVRVGSTQKFSDNWDNIFTADKPKPAKKAAGTKKKAKPSKPAAPAPAAKKSTKKKAAKAKASAAKSPAAKPGKKKKKAGTKQKELF
ncbi:MAG: RNA polymerase subunit sigma [Pirellula sp.]|nr:RNA polymerase subunit sigma [Pirellula sp.]